MMRKTVIGYNRISKKVQESLQKEYDFHFFKNIEPKANQEFLKVLEKAEGVIGLELQVDKELLDLAPNLKIVCNISTGYDNLDIPSLSAQNIMATNTPGLVEESTADSVFGILLATARRIPELDRFVKKGEWKEFLQEEMFGTNVYQKTLGIIGMGKVGSKIAKRAHCGFDMNILYCNRSRNLEAENNYNARYCDMETLLKESDFVLLMTPLTPETYELIGKREFQLMKNSAIFINGSRGKTVNETDLIQALKNREIRAAGVDVYQTEPVHPDNPLLKLDNAVTTPHIGCTTETELVMSMLAAENLRNGLVGKRPPNLINTEIMGVVND